MGKGAPVEERSFAETLSDAARYETSSEEEDEEEETLHRPSAPVPGPSMPRDLVTRAAIEQTVKMKQVRACNITALIWSQFSDLLFNCWLSRLNHSLSRIVGCWVQSSEKPSL